MVGGYSVFKLGDWGPRWNVGAFPVQPSADRVIQQNTVATARYRLSALRGHQLSMPGKYSGVCRAGGKIVPFAGILLHVIEFLGTVGVADVAPVPRADSVVVMIVCGDGRPWSWRVGILQLRQQAVALLFGGCRKAAECSEGWVDVEQFGWFAAHCSGLNTGAGENEGDSRGSVPQ